MGFFDKKLSFVALKDAVAEAATKVGETVQNIDVANKVATVKAGVSDAAAQVTEKVKNVDVAGTFASARETIVEVGERTLEVTQTAYEATRDKAALAYESAAEEVRNFDYTQLKSAEFYQGKFQHYKDLSQDKISDYFRSTFEVDKSTLQMVDDVRHRLPVPAETVDDIFAQCKKEAIRRAVASFGLAGLVQDLDQHSADKYSNLSETYKEFKDRSPGLSTHENYAAMNDIRTDAKTNGGILGTVDNGYNKGAPLLAVDADVEHVISKKEYYNDLLIRIGTTDEQMVDAINSKDNLMFANASFNRSLGDKDLLEHIEKVGRQDGDTVWVKIESTGEEVALSKKDVEEAYARADAQRNQHRLDAALEVGSTVVKSGAVMAAQQVVGLIIVETIDIFVDEIRDFAAKGKLINSDGWLQNTKDATHRIHQRLEKRFEERQIWARAKELGIESGVAGALSVIPQILISFILRMPAFVLAMIRESTLSLVRCVRILASSDANKLDSIGVILAGTASAIVSVYVSHVVSKAMMAVPLLKTFDRQVSDVFAGLLVTAVPLTAIYTFDQNKRKLQFMLSKLA
nr:hypothetical protein [uncultured Massilia sp.]